MTQISTPLPPQWLVNHPELLKRNIKLHPQGGQFSHRMNVWSTSPFDDVVHVVKFVNYDCDEAAIIELLQHNLASPNHTVPCEVIRSSDNSPCLLLMSFVGHSHCGNESGTYVELFDSFYQIAEGLEELHRRKVAHLDFAFGNVLRAPPGRPHFDSQIILGKWYIIDFEQALVFDQGPGHQPAIILPINGQVRKPEGLERLDPYSWDVYCLGHACRVMYKLSPLRRRIKADSRCIVRLLQWMQGDAQGCKGCTLACHCRPMARRVRQVLGVIRWCFRAWDGASRMFQFFCRT
ncbi:hypothetical protein BC835DRAFT_1343850 [Cytidiella melzeri]|nr:hypothetical protein BC835DRAFT_1343850 [Cytidiella melzeri]